MASTSPSPAPSTIQRHALRFRSGDADCAAWHYPGTNGACVIMAGGFAVTKEPATDLFARRFNDAGFSVLAFDYRHLGQSGGEPRQVARVGEQLADWRAAVEAAAGLPEVDPDRVTAWAFSASGGHLLRLGAEKIRLAAVIAQTPNADGPAATRNAMRYQKPIAALRFTGRALLDAAGSLVGRPPRLVPLAGRPGEVAMLTTPDAQEGDRALDTARYPEWQQAVAARSALRLTRYRPGRRAKRIRCPLLVVVCEQDRTALVEPSVRAAEQAPQGELARFPGGHYAPFMDQHKAVLAAEVAFLRRHVLDRA